VNEHDRQSLETRPGTDYVRARAALAAAGTDPSPAVPEPPSPKPHSAATTRMTHSGGNLAGQLAVGLGLFLVLVTGLVISLHPLVRPGAMRTEGDASLALLAMFGGTVLFMSALVILSKPHGIRLEPGGRLRLLSLWGSETILLSHVRAIVRITRQSDGELSGIQLEYFDGPIDLPGEEELFREVRRLLPYAQIKTRVYEDSPSGD
jgi:hypothetical protein